MSTSEHRSNRKDADIVETLLAENSKHLNEIEHLRSSQGKLEQRNSSLSAELMSSKSEHETIRRQLAEERAKNMELESKTVHLRSMLIPATETQLSDGEVVAKFTALRAQILKLVMSAWSRKWDEATNKNVTDHQFKIFSPFANGGVNMKYLDNRLRGVVFSILNDQIFSTRHYATDSKHAPLNQRLGDVERLLWQNIPRGKRHLIRLPVRRSWLTFPQTSALWSSTGALPR